MSFTQRGEMLRAMSRAMHAKRDELIALAMSNGGNTRGDAKFDIDGAIGTLAAYADLAPQLGDTHVLVDGDPIQLGPPSPASRSPASATPGCPTGCSARRRRPAPA
jgi:oxepin-CoA hydrolase/3-oxo-5,6-dehydrosuberyl-CoA semialdehyde dehydrogenase